MQHIIYCTIFPLLAHCILLLFPSIQTKTCRICTEFCMSIQICKKKNFVAIFRGVLTELCDVQQQGCNLDAKAFKGIFVRNLRYLVDATGSSNNIKGWEKIE